MKKETIVIGHKNPDTDSICSAISYAYFKNQTAEHEHIPMRAGDLNPETEYVLNYFNMEIPAYMDDVRAQVKDADYEKGITAHRDMPLREVWNKLHQNKSATITVIDDDRMIEGIISVGDIARFFMDNTDECILTASHTLCSNVVETVEGKLLVGNPEKRFESGDVHVATLSAEAMKNQVKKGDVVVMVDKKDAQLCAIENGAECIIACLGVEVDDDVLQAAEKSGCAVISTENDSYITARLLNQSIPVGYIMIKDKILTFSEDEYIDDVRTVVAETRHREFPLVDKNGKYIGILKRRNLLDVDRKKVILVDHNERAQAVKGAMSALITEIVDHHKIGHVQTVNPIFYRNMPVGATGTIVYSMFKSAGVEIPKNIAGMMVSAILSDTLLFRSPTCTPLDKNAAEELGKIAEIDIEKYALDMFAAGSDFGSKSDEEIFNLDYKRFSAGEITYGVGQVSSVSKKELEDMKPRMLAYMEKIIKEGSVDMVYLMLTDILEESSDLLAVGPGALKTAETAFNVKGEDGSVYLKGAVSRKKQIIPQITAVLSR